MSSKHNYLLGGVLSILRGKCQSLVEKNEIVKEPQGNWIAMPAKLNRKCVTLINIYRLLSSSQWGPMYCLTQHNIKNGIVKGTNNYRKEPLQQILKHVNSKKEVTDAILSGDFKRRGSYK